MTQQNELSCRASDKEWEVWSSHSIHNRRELDLSVQAGCFHCCRIYPAENILDFIDVADDTALCPHCEIDAVVGDASALPVCDVDVLKRVNRHAFIASERNENRLKIIKKTRGTHGRTTLRS